MGGEYAPNRVVTSFVGAFPHPDPEYLVYIVYDEPKPAEDTYGFATAGWNAARTVGAVVERDCTNARCETDNADKQKYARTLGERIAMMLCELVNRDQISGDAGVTISGLTADSRVVRAGDIFAAFPSVSTGGRDGRRIC